MYSFFPCQLFGEHELSLWYRRRLFHCRDWRWLVFIDGQKYADLLVFDLDPGSRLPFKRLCEAATGVKETLDTLSVNSGHSSYGASSADSEPHPTTCPPELAK